MTVRSRTLTSTLLWLSLAASLGTIYCPSAHAAGDEKAVKFGCKLRDILNTFHDPWTDASRNAKIPPSARFMPSMVVANLWRYHGKGKPLEGLLRDLPNLKEAGVQTIYFPPMHEQMLYQFFDATNDHGYWPKNWDFDKIDPKLGTLEQFEEVQRKIKELGMNMAIDVVPRHLGYAPADGWVELWGQRVSISDPNYFKQTPEPGPMDFAKAEINGPEMMHIYTDYKIWGLPNLNTENPFVAEHLIADHRKIAQKFNTFRVDATKHMSPWFVRQLLKAMAEEVIKRGEQPHFFLEHLSPNYGELKYYASLLGEVPGLHFIDFKMSGSLREVLIDGHSFEEIKKTAKASENIGFDRTLLIQTITDHDKYYPPIYQGNPDSANQTYGMVALANFTSDNRPYAAAGMETAVPPHTKTNEPRTFWDKNSEIEEHLSKLNHLFNEQFPKLADFESSNILAASQDSITIVRPYKSGRGKLALIIDRSRQSKNINRFLKENQSHSPQTLFRWGEFGGNVETAIVQLDN